MKGYQMQDFRKMVDDVDSIILKLPCQHLICNKCALIHHQQLSYVTCFLCKAAYFQKLSQFPQVDQIKLQQKYEIGCECKNEKKRSLLDLKLEEIEQSVKRKENEVIGQFMSNLYNLIQQKTVKIQKSINEKTKEKMQNYDEIMQVKLSFQVSEIKSKEIEFIEPKSVVNAADEEFLQHIMYEKQKMVDALNVCKSKIKQLNSPLQYEAEGIKQEQIKSKRQIEEKNLEVEGIFNQAALQNEESKEQNSPLFRND